MTMKVSPYIRDGDIIVDLYWQAFMPQGGKSLHI